MVRDELQVASGRRQSVKDPTVWSAGGVMVCIGAALRDAASARRFCLGPLPTSISAVTLACTLLAFLSLSAATPAGVTDRTYSYKGYKETMRFFEDLKRQNSDIVETFIAQEVFPEILPDGKSWATCEGEPCKTLIVRIANKKLLTNSTPEVFFSGALHGDEKIGPISVTELAAFLCEQYRLGDGEVKRLVDYRATWIMPMTNAYGYANSRRDENGMDPNRDFAYLQSPTHCMQTQTARAVNELFRRHLFHFMITFHGGMRALTYEWGSKNHMNGRKSTESPDNRAFVEVGASIQSAAGKDPAKHWWYPLGPINDLVYPVDGGMEDWSYGAGWESSPSPITVCRPTTYGGYDGSRTEYRKGSVATLVYLAEADDSKTPAASTLGHTAEIFSATGVGQGHVARNLRMCLKIIELARPEIVVHAPSVPAALLAGSDIEVAVHGFGCQRISSLKLLLVPKAVSARCDFGSGLLDGLDDVGFAGHTDVVNAATVLAELKDQLCRGLTLWERLGPDEKVLRLKGRAPDVMGEFCLVIAAEFDQHWAAQKHPDPGVAPRAIATRIRIDSSYSAQASDGGMVVNSHRTKLFAVSANSLVVTSPKATSLGERGGNSGGGPAKSVPGTPVASPVATPPPTATNEAPKAIAPTKAMGAPRPPPQVIEEVPAGGVSIPAAIVLIAIGLCAGGVLFFNVFKVRKDYCRDRNSDVEPGKVGAAGRDEESCEMTGLRPAE
ncbi:unnamed protein product [Polarella glacialis]|uniref:Peptidase M14 domain-containing protein n=1 Tax=Polarella glacialis TaxID=89957 RepID=A0A813GRB6_POLGL|nr:unnamed protein product [Polarella glacialis]CAE8710451.1 unnamed protein product [Polarella glacialis]